MKLLNKDLLLEYGFIRNADKTTSSYTVMTKNNVDIIMKDHFSFYYSNLGFDKKIKDLASLRKLYKELENEELKVAQK